MNKTLNLESRDDCVELHQGGEHELQLGGATCRLRYIGRGLELHASQPVAWGKVELKRALLPTTGRLCRGDDWLRWGPARPHTLPGMLGRTRPMMELADLVRRLAPVDLPVLIRGESGTGKELVARSLHELSARTGPFVAVNGATLSASLGGSQLFGHVRGAFTGAQADRQGAMRAAHGGTLFIDEVGSLCPQVQASLLRALEERKVRPVGADREVETDIRLVTATCEPLETAVQTGRFRRDLHQRMAATVVRVPPLHLRSSDIPLLARHVLDEHGFGHLGLSRAAQRHLELMRFPGNVRELRNLLVQAALQSDGACIELRDVERVVGLRLQGYQPRLQRMGRDFDLLQVLEDHGGNRSAAARALGIPRSTFRDWLKRADAA